MKQIFTILTAVLITATVWAQSPEKMSYQAVVRNSSGQLITNQGIGMQISILQTTATGTAVYVETHNTSTNGNGLVTIEIGTGTIVSGEFADINWSDDTYFIKTETDPTGGTNYTITGVSQLLSVPYALHAKTAETITGAVNYTETDPVYTASQAANISATDITNLGNLSGNNTGDQDLSTLATKTTLGDSIAKVRSEIPTIPVGTANGEMQYWNGSTWVMVTAGTTGQLLSVNASGIPEWQNPSSLKSAATQAPTMTAAGVTFNGVLNANGYSTTVAFEYGTTTSYGTTVTATQSPVSGATNIAITSALITNLIVGTTYHVCMITQNIFGTFYGDDIEFTYLYHGANYAGGLVFSIDNSGKHGLVCAPTDQSTVVDWSGAFTVCAGTIGGYTDWSLPSKSTLNLMYENLKTQGLGGFASGAYYWSSTEYSNDFAWLLYFDSGTQDLLNKDYPNRVRAVRAF